MNHNFLLTIKVFDSEINVNQTFPRKRPTLKELSDVVMKYEGKCITLIQYLGKTNLDISTSVSYTKIPNDPSVRLVFGKYYKIVNSNDNTCNGCALVNENLSHPLELEVRSTRCADAIRKFGMKSCSNKKFVLVKE